MSRRKASSKMKNGNVSVHSKITTIKTTKKERGDAWSGKGFNDLDNKVLPYNSEPIQIGKAIKGIPAICR